MFHHYFNKVQFNLMISKFKYAANINHKKYGISKYAEIFDVLWNKTITHKTKIKSNNITPKAKYRLCELKNIGDQSKLKINCIPKTQSANVFSLFSPPFIYKNTEIAIKI